MDFGETYDFNGHHDGIRYEIATYPAWDNDWAEGRVEVNGEVARVVPSRWYPRATPTPTPAAGVLAELIAAEEIEERSLMQELRELVNTAEWELEEMLEQRREVA